MYNVQLIHGFHCFEFIELTLFYIHLSEAFIKKYENVDFVNFPFGDFVRDVYKVRKWESPEPQGKHTAAPQQPNKSIST